MPNKLTKTYDNPEGGQSEYSYTCWNREYQIDEWNGTFTVHESVNGGEDLLYRCEAGSLDGAVATITVSDKPKGPFQIAPQIPGSRWSA